MMKMVSAISMLMVTALCSAAYADSPASQDQELMFARADGSVAAQSDLQRCAHARADLVYLSQPPTGHPVSVKDFRDSLLVSLTVFQCLEQHGYEYVVHRALHAALQAGQHGTVRVVSPLPTPDLLFLNPENSPSGSMKADQLACRTSFSLPDFTSVNAAFEQTGLIRIAHIRLVTKLVEEFVGCMANKGYYQMRVGSSQP